MKPIVGVLGLILAYGLFASVGKADFNLSIETNLSFQADSGFQLIDVYGLSNNTESALSLTAGFTLGGGAVFEAPNAGVFGAGFLGDGNINAGSSFFARNPGNASNAALSIDFISSQVVPANKTRIAAMSIDTTNLAPGTYTITINSAMLGTTVGTFAPGSFEITAVPEPATFLTVAISLGGLWIAQRRLRRPQH